MYINGIVMCMRCLPLLLPAMQLSTFWRCMYLATQIDTAIAKVRNAAGQRASIGTVIVMNERNYVVAWYAVNSTSPRHIAGPVRELIKRNKDQVRCVQMAYAVHQHSMRMQSAMHAMCAQMSTFSIVSGQANG
jgi:hypothetical protein